MTRRLFHSLPEGDVEEVAISNGALTAKLLNWGALLRDLRLEGVAHPLVMGFERFEDYRDASPYAGAIAGRVANRISGARFTLDGREIALERNRGAHHIHGGGPGVSFGRRLWRVEEAGPAHVVFALSAAAGEAGYPGALEVRARYAIARPATLTLEIEATADAPTPFNLAHHSYFNLDGSADARDHVLTIPATRRTRSMDDDIPDGGLHPVAGTGFDFREARSLREAGASLYDTNFILADARRADPHFAARLAAGGVSLEVWTTEPGVQLYDAGSIKPAVAQARGLDGRAYAPYAAIALEPQNWPDAVSHAHFPDPILRPGAVYRQRSEFRFGRD